MNGFIFLAECGLAPTVILKCTYRSAHVEWVASQPGCQYDCKASWSCVNGTYTHKEEVTRYLAILCNKLCSYLLINFYYYIASQSVHTLMIV